MITTHVSTIEAKEKLSELLNRVVTQQERFVLTRRDKEIAVLISFEDFKLLQKIQNKTDLENATEALREARKEGSLTLEEFKTELGQTK